ncbi:unnamed protein product [Symbiodinium natans]|uniref:Uncharacterized protein n=1 Tax=Symbiodinium natans TaxID=878477 RepID=A0A812PRH7_9DINO|nr:unnamed protein product [Symbiodinium natans]
MCPESLVHAWLALVCSDAARNLPWHRHNSTRHDRTCCGQAFRIKGPLGPGACLYRQYMAGARLYGGPDFSRSCGAQQSHTSAGTALAAALVAASPKACDLDASNKDRLWLPRAACTSSTQATHRDGYPRAAFTGSADDVPTQWLAPPAAVPTPAEPRRETRRPSTGRPPALRAAQTDPGVGRPAGMRTPRAVRAWQSADEALVAEVHCKAPGGGPDVAMAEDAGWAPNRQFLPEELRYNPITHEVEVYVNRDGNVQKCEPSAQEYREARVMQAHVPRASAFERNN